MIDHSVLNMEEALLDNTVFIDRADFKTVFDQAKDKALVTVIAGAGFGKSAAVSNYFSQKSNPVIWVQLSMLDNLIKRFWDHIIHAAWLYNQEMAEKLSGMEFPESIKDLAMFTDILSSYIPSKERFYIILDDFHLIQDPVILHFIENLVSIRVPYLTIVLLSRTDPNIRVAGLKSKGQVAVVKEEHLRFSFKETEEYYAALGINFSRKTLTKIHSATEGWIFAIFLIGIAARKSIRYETGYIETIQADIFQFIETEIFSLFSEPIQKTLVRISLLGSQPIGLVRMLFESNSSFFTELDNINSFVHYDTFTSSCHIHHLFKDFLCSKQSLLTEQEKSNVYLSAARWCNQNNMPVDAILYYEKIGAYQEILEIIQSHYASSSKETAQFIMNIMKRAPSELYDKNRIIGVFYAKFLMNNLMMEESYAECVKIIDEYQKFPVTKETSAILGEIHITLGLLRFYNCLTDNQYNFSEYFRKADEYLPEGSKLINNTYSLNVGVYACPVGCASVNGMNQFKDGYYKAVPYLDKVMNGCGFGNEYLISTEIAFYQRDFSNAIQFANQCIGKASQQDQYDMMYMSCFYLLRIYIALGNYPAADTTMAQIEKLNTKYRTSMSNRLYDIISGWYYSQTHQFEQIPKWIFEDEESEKILSINFALDKIVRAITLLERKKYSEFLGFLKKCKQKDSLYLYLVGKIELNAMEAVALYYSKEQQQAFSILEEAYRLAKPDGLVMPFIQLGMKMRTLAQAALKSKNHSIPSGWLKELSTKSSTYAKSLARIITENTLKNQTSAQEIPALTQKEIEILQNLCNGLTREEIAENLNISTNTIKSRVQTIYQKLGALNSYDAIRIATKYDLLS